MIRDARQIDQIMLQGGLDYETPGATKTPGRMLACQNYEIDLLGGYGRIAGYERFSGQPEPHQASGDLAIDRRNAIGQLPGSGPVRGVHVHNGVTYALRDSLDGTECRMFRSSPIGWELMDFPTLTFIPGGTFQIISYSFAANPFGEMILVDGVNSAALVSFTGLATGTSTRIVLPGVDTPPIAVAANNNILYLGTEAGSLFYSRVGLPLDFNATLGAGEIGVGGAVTGLYPLVGGALCIQTKNQIAMLYGTTEADLQKKDVRPHDDLSGALRLSSLSYNDLYFIGDRGITSLSATQSFGSFESGSFSKGIAPFIQARKEFFTCAVQSVQRNQLRWVFNAPTPSLDGSEIISATFRDGKLAGFTRQVLGFRVSCAGSGELADGSAAVFMGSSDGWVYRMDVGTSFDGLPIPAYFMTAFGNSRQAARKKSYKHATINIQSNGPVPVKAKPIFDYGASDVMSHRVEETNLIGGASNYDEANWDAFTWSAPHLNQARVEMQGIGQNVALLISSTSADAKPHSIFDIEITYTLRGLRL